MFMKGVTKDGQGILYMRIAAYAARHCDCGFISTPLVRSFSDLARTTYSQTGPHYLSRVPRGITEPPNERLTGLGK